MPSYPNSRFSSRILILFVAVLLLLGPALPAAADDARPLPDLDIILIIDESGSMWLQNDRPVPATLQKGTPQPGWDHPGWRIVMANMFANVLGIEQSGANHRLSVVVFGSDAKLASPLADIQDLGAREAFLRAIDANHKNMTWTNIPEALRLAMDEIERTGRLEPNVKRAIVVLTDGKHETHDAMTEAETAAANKTITDLAEQRAAGKYPIYTIGFTEAAFGADPKNKIYKNLLEQVAGTTGGLYFEIPEPPNNSTEEKEKQNQNLLDVYMKVLFHLWGLPATDVPAAVQSPTDVPVEINQDMYEAIITIVKYNRDVQTSLIRPDGTVVRPTDPGIQYASSPLTDSYSVSRPAKGTWTVRMTGEGKVIVVPIIVPPKVFKVDRSLPAAVHPQGKPMDMRVRVLDLDQNPIVPQRLDLSVKSPDRTDTQVPLALNGNTYTARREDTSQRGEYVLTFDGDQNGVPVKDQHQIKVIAAPWLRLLDPVAGKVYPANRPVPVQGQLMFQTEMVKNPDQADRYEVVVRVTDSNGQAVDTRQLGLRPGGLFTGELNVDAEGSYTLRAELAVTKPSGERFEDVSEVSIDVHGRVSPTPSASPVPTLTWTPSPLPPIDTPTPSPTPVPPPPAEPPKPGTIAGIGGGLIVLLGAAFAGWRYASAPALSGMFEFGGQMYPLSGKRTLTIGTAPRSPIPLQGEGVAAKHAQLRPIGSRKSPQVEIRSIDPANSPVSVNEIPVPSQILRNGDVIQIGDQRLTYSGIELDEDFGSFDFDNDAGAGTGPTGSDEWSL